MNGDGSFGEVLAGEARRLAFGLAAAFAMIALALLALGLALPRRYEAATTLRLEENPLLNGLSLADAGAPAQRLAHARGIVLGRGVMDEVLRSGGWLASTPAPNALDRDRLIGQIARRTAVTSPGDGLVRIAYADEDPRRALAVARRYAELYPREAQAARARQSRDAFDFIDARVRALEARGGQAGAEPGAGAAAGRDAVPAAGTGLHRDLLERRERLRVAMELDAAGQGLAFHVVEPALLPTRPQGLRLAHLLAAGLALGVLVPLAWLVARVRFDPRVRSAAQVERVAGVAVLAWVPPYPTPALRRREALRGVAIAIAVAAVLLAYAAAAWMRQEAWP